MCRLAPAPRLQALTVEKEHDNEFGMGESDDEVGDEEEAKRNFFSFSLHPSFNIRDDGLGVWKNYKSEKITKIQKLDNQVKPGKWDCFPLLPKSLTKYDATPPPKKYEDNIYMKNSCSCSQEKVDNTKIESHRRSKCNLTWRSRF